MYSFSNFSVITKQNISNTYREGLTLNLPTPVFQLSYPNSLQISVDKSSVQLFWQRASYRKASAPHNKRVFLSSAKKCIPQQYARYQHHRALGTSKNLKGQLKSNAVIMYTQFQIHCQKFSHCCLNCVDQSITNTSSF